jgi:ribosomal protein S18 acetylase RimI-like enzyme
MPQFDRKKLIYRRGRAEDATAIAMLFDVANRGLIRRGYQPYIRKGQTWLDVAKIVILNPQAQIYYQNCIIVSYKGASIGYQCISKSSEVMQKPDLSKIEDNAKSHTEFQYQNRGQYIIRDIAIKPEFEGHGIGTDLAGLSVQHVMQTDQAILSLMTHETNIAAQRIYTKWGFEIVDRKPVLEHPHYAADSFWVVMSLDLAKARQQFANTIFPEVQP